MSDRLQGIEANLALMAAIEPAARAQLRTDMATLAATVLQMQRDMAPKKTGALANALQISEQVDLLRFRIGLPTLTRKSGRGGTPTWYGVIVEYGRTAGEAQVTRRKKLAPRGKSRHANPNGYTTYQLHWTGLAPRPFVHVEPKVQSAIDALRARFWDAALHRAQAES